MLRTVIEFIKRNSRALVLGLITFSLILSISLTAIKESSSRVNTAILGIFSPISEGFSKITSGIFSFAGQNMSDEEITIAKLEEENSQLRKKLINETLSKAQLQNLQSLEKALNFVDDKYKPSMVSGKIIAKNDGRYFKTFTVSAGKKDGIKENSIVIAEDGLVGRVFEVSENYSKVISILDTNASVSVEILGNAQETGIINQDINLSFQNDMQGDLISGYTFNINSKIKKGDTIITSGMGIYPEGIPVGKVEEVVDDNQQLLKYMVIKPFVDFESLDIVMMINPREDII